HAVLEVERREELVAGRIEATARPLVHGEAVPRVADDENRVERREPEHPLRGPAGGDDLEAVVAPRAEAADRAHRVAADTVGDEPLPGRGGVDVAAELGPEAHGSLS